MLDMHEVIGSTPIVSTRKPLAKASGFFYVDSSGNDAYIVEKYLDNGGRCGIIRVQHNQNNKF